jgi:hypothetical protein
MNMPGFSAEASLYKTSGSYRMAGALGQADAAIRPAALDAECVLEWGGAYCRRQCGSSRTCYTRCIEHHCRWFA